LRQKITSKRPNDYRFQTAIIHQSIEKLGFSEYHGLRAFASEGFDLSG
jgi:hypothetical protein